ncbi:MAG: hypothetical protein ACO3S8_07465 [Aquiluna sp.]
MKVYIAMHLSQGEWVPLGEIPHAFSCEESAWKALAIAYHENDAFKQAVVSIDEEQYRVALEGWLKRGE